jgi:hypothetical protein
VNVLRCVGGWFSAQKDLALETIRSGDQTVDDYTSFMAKLKLPELFEIRPASGSDAQRKGGKIGSRRFEAKETDGTQPLVDLTIAQTAGEPERVCAGILAEYARALGRMNGDKYSGNAVETTAGREVLRVLSGGSKALASLSAGKILDLNRIQTPLGELIDGMVEVAGPGVFLGASRKPGGKGKARIMVECEDAPNVQIPAGTLKDCGHDPAGWKGKPATVTLKVAGIEIDLAVGTFEIK